MSENPRPAFEDSLFTALRDVVNEERVTAAHRVRPRRFSPALRAGIGLAGVAAATATVVASGVLPGGTADAVALTTTADGSILLLGDLGLEEDGDIQAALNDLGIETSVETIPVSPSLRGQVFGMNAEMGEGHEVVDGQWTFSTEYAGTVGLTVGAEGAPGEDYAVTGSAFADGELLAGVGCDPGWELQAQRLPALIADRDVTIEWYTVSVTGPDNLDPDPQLTTGEVPAGLVSSASAVDDRTVAVYVLPAADVPAGFTPEAPPCPTDPSQMATPPA